MGSLGEAHRLLRDPKQAIEFHEKRLQIEKEIGNRYKENQVIVNLGAALANFGNIPKAIECYQQLLILAQTIDDVRGITFNSYNLTIALFNLGRL